MKGLLAFAGDMTEQVIKEVSNKRALKRMLTTHLDEDKMSMNSVPMMLDSARKFVNQYGKKSTGLNNILLIN